MPSRAVVSRELAQLFGLLAHADRIRLVQELRHGEVDVGHLQTSLGISHSRVSQHLATLRAHRVVIERREGRHVYYRLTEPELAHWVLAGATFLTRAADSAEQFRDALDQVRELWGEPSVEPETVK